MFQTLVWVGWVALVALVATSWRSLVQRQRAWERLAGDFPPDQPVTAERPRFARRIRRRWRLVPWLFGAALALIAWRLLSLDIPYVAAFGVLIALLGSQIEAFVAAQHLARLEVQLADAIDIMIGAVGAGASVGAAMEAARVETPWPLRPQLEEVVGRIRLGDNPAEVYRALAERIPLETFLLFASALAVHSEVGGRLAPTLATVGRTIRDRVEISRRIRSNIAQSQFSTIAIVGLTYFIAVIVWRNGPEQMEEFVRSSVGSWFVAGSIVLQAVGIVWMNMISNPRF